MIKLRKTACTQTHILSEKIVGRRRLLRVVLATCSCVNKVITHTGKNAWKRGENNISRRSINYNMSIVHVKDKSNVVLRSVRVTVGVECFTSLSLRLKCEYIEYKICLPYPYINKHDLFDTLLLLLYYDQLKNIIYKFRSEFKKKKNFVFINIAQRVEMLKYYCTYFIRLAFSQTLFIMYCNETI